MADWIGVVVDCRLQDAGAVDEALEAVGLRHIVRDGHKDVGVVACASLHDLCWARIACASIPNTIEREDLELALHDPTDAERAREILKNASWIDAEVIVLRALRLYLRDAAILGGVRTEMVTRLGINTVAVEVMSRG